MELEIYEDGVSLRDEFIQAIFAVSVYEDGMEQQSGLQGQASVTNASALRDAN